MFHTVATLLFRNILGRGINLRGLCPYAPSPQLIMKSSQNGKTAQQIAEEKEQIDAPKKGILQRIRVGISDWWQKNTREMRLASSIILWCPG